MNFIYVILYSGHQVFKTSAEKRGVILSNAVGLSLFLLSLILFVFYYFWFKWNLVTAAIPCIGLLSFATVLLNKYHFTNASRIWISVFIPAVITALSIYSKILYYKDQTELDYFAFRFVLLGCCTFPWVLFSFRDRKSLVYCSVAGLLVLLLFDPLHFLFNVGYNKDEMKISTYYFTNIVIFLSYCLMISALAFLKWISEKNERKNLILIDELNQTNEILVEKNAEIEAQTSELQAQSEILEFNQNQLMDAYLIIQDQKDKVLAQNQSLSSELVEKNNDLTETNTELIKHNNELRQFSYTVSHNLRGPVASLLGLVDLIHTTKLDVEAGEIYEHIKNSTLRLDAIIKDLTKIIDIRQDIFKIRQKISLDETVKEIIHLFRRDIELHNVSITKKFTNLTTIYSVKPMVHSILYNLLSNAIKYRSPDRQPIIEIISSEDEDDFILELRDNGLGIDIQRNKENLFKLYKRFHFHTEGKGLGLYLVKLQVEALGGSIDIESEINRFTTFTIRIQKPKNLQRQILYKEAHAELFFDALINATGVIWHGPITSEQYRSAFLKCLDFLKSYNAPNYITDLTHQGPIEKQDQLWMLSEILPAAAGNGLRRIATIRPDALDAHVSDYLSDINTALKNFDVVQKYFLSMQAAVEWLQEENEKVSLKIVNHGKNTGSR